MLSTADFAHRRARVAQALNLAPDELLLISAGDPLPLPENTDQTYPFRAHSEYVYLTGLDSAGGVLAFDPREGAEAGWRSFVPEVTEAERVWEARQQMPGEPLSGLADWLATRAGRSTVVLGTPYATKNPAADSRVSDVRDLLRHARRPKDATELALLRRTAAATAAGFAAAKEAIWADRTEREVQIELETAFFRAGATRTGYDTIVGTGPNAAVLHFSPSNRAIREGDFVLVDAGAEIDRYVTDVTRTYVAGGNPTAFQRDLHQLVVSAERAAIDRCRPGAEWKEIHLQAAIEMTAGLVDLGLMRGNAESLVEREAHTLFYPHGLGHLVGLGVRDASGRLPGRQPDPRPMLRSLRSDFPLQEGYVTTVEPGLYFIPALLDDPARRERFADCVNWAMVEEHRDLGGVRIEDNILVTADGPVILTDAIPLGW